MPPLKPSENEHEADEAESKDVDFDMSPLNFD